MRVLALIALAASLTLAGCTAAEPVAAPAPIPSPTPAVALGPVELSVEEAGVYYLRLVCQSNTAGDALTAAIRAGEQDYLYGGAPDPSAAKAAAAEQLRLGQLFVEVLEDDYYTWPDGVAEQLVHLRSRTVAELGSQSVDANAATYSEIYYNTYPAMTAEQTAAPQEIRLSLGLSADTTASCAGYETGLDVVVAEIAERNVAIEDYEADMAEYEAKVAERDATEESD